MRTEDPETRTAIDAAIEKARRTLKEFEDCVAHDGPAKAVHLHGSKAYAAEIVVYLLSMEATSNEIFERASAIITDDDYINDVAFTHDAERNAAREVMMVCLGGE